MFPRTLLCTTAVIQTLYAYPVAGSQIFFIQIFLVVLGIISVGDFFWWLGAKYGMGTRHHMLLRVSNFVLLLCLALDYGFLAFVQRERYKSLPALNLLGANRIHLRGQQAKEYKWLTRSALNYCDIFVGLPNIPSLNLWTGMAPPARLNIDDWILVLTDKEQLDIASALSTHPNACAVYNPELLAVWDNDHHDISSLPLVRYINENFKPVGSMGNYVFLVRNGRDLNRIPGGSP